MLTNHAATLACDGCGLPASPEHIARRLKRLEWATRYRPVHISTLFLGAVSPSSDAAFLYFPAGEEGKGGTERRHEGEAAWILSATGVGAALAPGESSSEANLAEFQHRGYFLTHVLECPASEAIASPQSLSDAIARQLPKTMARIRRSLRPKRIALISEKLQCVLEDPALVELGVGMLLDEFLGDRKAVNFLGDRQAVNGKPFASDGEDLQGAAKRLRSALARAVVAR